MLLNCGVGEDSWESLGLQGDPPDVKSWFIGKDPDAGKDWRQEEKGTTGDEMVGWHHILNGHEFEWAPGVDDGQGSLACCSPWGSKELDTTNWTELWDVLKLGWRYLSRNNMSHSRWLESLLVQGSGDISPVCFGVQPLPSYVGCLELSWEILPPQKLNFGGVH